MIYDYRCSECEHIFDRVLPVSQMHIPKEHPCPECETIGSIERYISAPSTIVTSTVNYKGDDTFQRDVLGKLQKSVPSRLRADTKFDVPKY